jgi:uncharacterized protein YbjQ (UPF0145 family)
MKKGLFHVGMIGMVLTFGILAVGCASSQPPNVMANTSNISGYVALDPSQYTILGTVSASSTVTLDRANGVSTGDTSNYGYIGDEESGLAVGEARTISSSFYGLMPTTTTVVTTPQGSAHKAQANAMYELIQQAKAKGADSIIHVTTDVRRALNAETNVETVTVDVSGIAIKVN